MEDNHSSTAMLDKMKEIADGCMGDAPAYCVAACPMGTDVKGYVGLISEGSMQRPLNVCARPFFFRGLSAGSALIPAKRNANAGR